MPRTIVHNLTDEAAYEMLDELHDWSRNFEAGRNPGCMFLDISGYSEEEYGVNIADNIVEKRYLGYMEMVMLGNCLLIFDYFGYDQVFNWIDKIHLKESQEEE